jgi:hypothetical protein
MDLPNQTLDRWLETAPANEFPYNGNINYHLRYRQIDEYLNNNVHPHVTPGAMLQDGGFLTDHGPEHIRTVIHRASELVKSRNCRLTGYEVYILLVAIHLHDVGNIFGRHHHELNSQTIQQHLGLLLGEDNVEKRWIYKIAQAHGGDPKNKIDSLPQEQRILGQTVRVQLLAAILKFADELADDNTRAARYLALAHLLPEESRVFHMFAQALHSVIIDTEGHEVKLHFELRQQDIIGTYGKGDQQVYLLDEIFARTTKTHLERVYCMRFMGPFIRIDRISVQVDFFNGNDEIRPPVHLRIEETGYPEAPPNGIYDLCPELTPLADGVPLNGETLKREIEDQSAGSQDGTSV